MEIEFHLLETITNKFSDENKVGSGGYGDVYQGVYKGKEIAVKRLRTLQGIDDKAFDDDFRSLSKVQHKNVVQFLGYCYKVVKKDVPGKEEQVKEMERILCFEFMEGVSLNKHITDEYCRLDWHTCYQIIKGTCEGLNHIHEAHGRPILHLDLKPSNILLDISNRTAKIADLGLCRLVATTETHKTQIVNVKGKLGYMPPEYIDGGYISKKYDVFSLGVIILKIMTGNKGHSRCYDMSPEQFMKHAVEIWERRLQRTSRNSLQEKDMIQLQVKICIEIALRCVEKDRVKRPLIKDIINELEGLDGQIKSMILYSYLPRDLICQSASIPSLPLQHLKDITNSFSDERILGRGGFGIVYKGELHNGETLAVKKLWQALPSTEKQFVNEVNVLMKLKHQNIVRLIGYCHDSQPLYMPYQGKSVLAWNTESLLCLEYMPNGSLDTYISDASCGLNWHTRCKVIEGISYGLQYLHEHSNEPIIHLDLKPANILLDANMCPKITDFGLSRLFGQNKTIHTSNLSGTFGYMSPEVLRGIITPMADIFSLGVIILEVITGHRDYPNDIRESEHFIELELQKWRNRIDKDGRYASLETIKTFIQIGILCVDPERTKRPTMKRIIDMLETSFKSNILAVDLTMELRFLFEPRKDISTCLQLTNQTDGFIAFRLKTNQAKYSTQPTKGIMPPYSRCFICVTLRAQDEVPPNMWCDDMLHVQSAPVSDDHASSGIVEDEFMTGPAVDVVSLPIVYVALDQV